MNSAITRRGDRRGAIAIALVPYACSPSVDRVELPRPVDDAARVAAIETPTRLDARLVRAGAPLPTLALDGEPAELYVVDLGATADSLALDPTLDRLGDDAAPPYRTLVGARAVWRRGLDDDDWRELGAPSVAVRHLRLPLVPPCAEVHPLELYRARTGEPLALVEDFGRVWVGVGPSTWFELVGNALVAVAPLVEGLTVTASMRSSDDAATVIAGRRDRFDELWARRRGERDWRRIASVEGSTRAHARIQRLSSVHEDLNFTLSLDGHLVRWRGATATPLYRAPAPALGVEGEGEVAAPNANRVFIVEPFDPSSDDDRFLAEIATDDGRLLRRVGVVPKQLWTIGYIPALGDLMIGGAVGPPIALSQFASTPTGIGITLSAIRQIIPASQGPWRGYASVDNGGSVRLYWRGLDPGLSTTTIGRCELTSLGLAGERIVQKGYGFAISARDSEPPYETLLFWLEPTTP